ncbi:putative ABC bile acid transporter [Aspergillus lucknowensis]|uniref:Integral peroxisomal membrane peroxin-domain-containing protein n=1 Tax=Aspergillus lucknowensis TaxID=176173 RepID=A0ABR4LXN7_9EURO
MEEYTAEAFADRDDPLSASRGRQNGTPDDLGSGRPGRSISSARQSMQDRLLTKILQQVIPVEDVNDESISVGVKSVPTDAKRPAFSLPVMGNNFRRFNARIGIVFKFQIQVERQLSWKQPSHTLSFLFAYSFVCLDPHLLVVLPIATILLFVMVPAFLARHPPPPSTSTSSITPYYSYQGPALAPAKTIRPAPETSKDFFRNMRDLQNSMADFSDLHDSAVSALAPLTNFSNERLSSAVFLSCTLLTAVLFLTSHLIPWRYIMLVGGNALILSKHPNIQGFLHSITDDLGSGTMNPVPPVSSAASQIPLVRLLGDIALDSFPEEREVEIFEIQYRSLAPYAERGWETFLFSAVPYDPLSPSRIAGGTPKGCRFFEDVQPPAGWAWKSKKWELDLDCREWVVERMITGVGFEVPGSSLESGAGTDEIGGWVWDLPSISSPRGDDDVASALGYQSFAQTAGENKKGKKKGKERALQDFEEKGNTGPNIMGEWRRRRWDSANARLSLCAIGYFALIPAAVISCAWLSYVLRKLPFVQRPKWTRPFVQELPPSPELPLDRTKHRRGWVVALLAISILGSAAELIKLVLNGPSVADCSLLISWVGTVVLVATEQPRTCPKVLLVYYLAAGILEAAFISNRKAYGVMNLFAYQLAASASFLGCVIALIMPLRPASLPRIDISAVGQKPSSDFRSPEDNLRLWQFFSVSWMAPLMSVGKNRQLDESDVWYLGFEFQHRRLHEKFRQLKGSVIGRLLQANGIDILIISTISIVQLICESSAPLLLQQLLQAMKDEKRSNRVAAVYAILSLVVGLIAAQFQVFGLWYGRRCYERSRGEMMMMVYEKALLRKNVFDRKADEKLGESEDQEAVVADDPPKKSRLWGFLTFRRGARKGKAKTAVSMGKIFNILRGDVYEVAQRFWEVDYLINQPLGLVIAVTLVWKVLGPSCFLGVLVVLIGQLINVFITRGLIQRERVRRSATDARLQVSSQFVEALRHLRWYGWQSHWLRQVTDARNAELRLRVITRLWSLGISIVNMLASGLFPVVALYAYTLLAGHPLGVEIIFPALQLFTMLESRLREIPNLITVLINASIAMERIEDFMAEPDKETRAITSSLDSAPLQLETCSFAWPGKSSVVLSEISLSISQGLTVVHGKVGAGKTALLQALLGELDKKQGTSYISNEMIGYCAQTPWLQSMSIRDNILFSSPYDEQRYKRVLNACALLPDLANFKHGDLSFVGENGIGLSGGQKARVALARAVYSTSRILLLDDPLSALDHNTAEFVVRKCLTGPLMEGRVVVLVTHRIHLVRHLADQIVLIQNGRAALEAKSSLDAETDQTSSSSQGGSSDAEDGGTELEDHSAAVPSKFIEEEHRAEWGVKAAVYWNYIKAGKYRWWCGLIFFIAVYRLSAVGQTWFLKEWGEGYREVAHVFGHRVFREIASFRPLTAFSTVQVLSEWTPKNPLDDLPAPIEDVRPWLLAFLGITTFQALAMLVARLFMLVIVYCAGKKLFQEVMIGVSHATFRFFDVTPVGRLMNRLTSDIGVVDGDISLQFQTIAFLIITWVSSIVVIASVTPVFLAFSILLTGVFIVTFLHFLPTSQSLRRLEMVSLSPLISNFGELLHGLTTVRAFHAEPRFQDRVIAVVDKFQGMDHFYWSLQSWLTYRFEGLSALAKFCLTVLALYTDVSPGLAAFVLTAANGFVTATHGLCRTYGQLQMDFVSVERVDELLHVDQEPPGTIDPPASWPKFGGDIVFEDVSIRYAPHLDPSFKNITLRIPGGSTTALVGRTGSGKSTLAVSLLGAIQPESGRILIDDIDISEVNKQSLRTRVTFVAQDPVLFPGSVRHNLDPTEEYSDEECSEVLRRICAKRGWTLETHVEAGGRNLSQGERQLIGLARAVLRRSSIVILDEATASIDHESSLEIQQILREEMRESTVVTIAHRLEAIKDADYFVELEAGSVARSGYVRDM